MTGLQLPEPHGLTRAEWERRFGDRLVARLALQPLEREHIIPGELESWPEHDAGLEAAGDWQDYTPEEAADENLTNWTPD